MTKPSLTDALKKSRPAQLATRDSEPDTLDRRAPSRLGRKAVTIYLETEAHQQLKMLAVNEGRSVQALMVEAINDLFEKHRIPRIAD